MSPRTVIGFHRLGPYHRARIQAVKPALDLRVLEVCGLDRTYLWPDEAAPREGWYRLFDTEDEEVRSFRRLRRRVRRALVDANAEVVALPGWSEPWVLLALAWCRENGVPAILMSDSTRRDMPRHSSWETVKRHLCGAYHSAFVSGTRAKEYLESLGVPSNQIDIGFDVVDNAHFTKSKEKAAERQDGHRGILASARFIPRKNLIRLLRAFASFREARPESTWTLSILGDGQERDRLLEEAEALGVREWTILPGWAAYEDLPQWYGRSKVFVHPALSEQWGLVVNEAMASGLPVLVSEACGCARDLVLQGENGFLFDPESEEELASLLTRIWDERDQLSRMGDRSREIAARWDLAAFRGGLLGAIEKALEAKRRGTTRGGEAFIEGVAWVRFALRLVARRREVLLKGRTGG